jgi:putative hydrolase of the HAD superfamily
MSPSRPSERVAAVTVVFDLGMVLCEPTGLYAGLSDRFGLPAADFEAVYMTHRPAYDLGLPARDYWARTLAELDLSVDLATVLPDLVAFDNSVWSEPRPTALALLVELRQRDIPVVILSNAPQPFADAAPAFSWRPLAERWFFSAELGLAKPDPAIYAHVERVLARPPGHRLLFIDDRPDNVAAATARGWQAHLWVDDADTRAWLVANAILQP